MTRLHWPGFVLLLALACAPAASERSAPRVQALAEDSGARVIVKFRAGASLLRAHALSATNHTATQRALDERAAVLGARLSLRMSAGAALSERVQVVQAQGLDARTLAARLALDPDVESARVDRRMRRLLVPNDPHFAAVAAGPSSGGPIVGQWYLRAPAGEVVSSINATSAWDTTTGSASVVVAVLDTGVRFDHPDLAGKLLPGYDMVDDAAIANDGDRRDSDASDPGDWVSAADAATSTFAGCGVEPSSWHGTQIAGIIAAATDNGVGMAGAGWNVRVLPVRVLGKCFGYTSDIVTGIRWAAGIAVPGLPPNPNPARVINLSLGSAGACSVEERDAIAEVTAAGAVVVVAAGNSAGLAANSPSNCPGVIGVAALRHVGTKVGFSDVGPELAIGAPGGNCVNVGAGEPCLYPILTTVNSGAFGPQQSTYTDSFDISVGTSFAAPLVAATAALMLSAQPALTPAGVRAAMRATARAFPSSGVADDPFSGPLIPCHAPSQTQQLQCYCTQATCGAGMLDAGAAVRAALFGQVAISVSPSAPVAGQALSLSASGSTVAVGRSIVAWQWSLVDGGGVVSGFASSTTAATVNLLPTAAGSFSVRLVLSDDLGVSVSALHSVSVAPAPAPPPAASGGGGAVSWPWLLALLMATLVLAAPRFLRPRSDDPAASANRKSTR